MKSALLIHLFYCLLLFCVQAASAVPTAELPPIGHKLTVGVYPAEPFNIRRADGSWTGISVDLWREIASDLKVDFEFREIPVADRFTALMTGWIDVCIGPITVTAEREEQIDFTHRFFTSGLRVAMRTKDAAPNSNLVLPLLKELLSGHVLKIVLSILGILLAASLLIWVSERRKNAAHFGGNGKRFAGIGSAVWWSAVTMTGVGYGDLYPRTLLGRIIAIGWMFVSLVMIAIFTATMASLLTAEKLGGPKPIQTPEDLRSLSIGTAPDTTAEQYAKMNHLKFKSMPAEQLLPALKSGKIDAVINDAPILYYLIHAEYENTLVVLPIHLDEELYGFGVKEGSPLREYINRSLLERLVRPEWHEVLRGYLGEYE
ncbi:MAG: transporter substrate-binding domain-containing protein [Verrucomicrobia bacterium]|nr:transporter substrate-binding domain-containing protein [Verrucomicrobiota bacterium]